MLTPLTDEQVRDLNDHNLPSFNAQIGTRIKEDEANLLTHEAFGVLAHSYASAHADKTYATTDLSVNSIVRITLTLADAAANLILPAAVKKLYIIVNTSGQAITVKVAGATGIVVASTKTAVLMSNGLDFVRLTADA